MAGRPRGRRRRRPSEAVALAGGLHVVPEFLGNRAPFADPHARAVIAGLGMERDVDSLVALYVAGLCGLGYGLRQIIETQAANGAPVEAIAISGGAGRHPLVRQLLADATGLPVLATRAEEPVLLGSAILGAVAAGAFPDIRAAMAAMSSVEATSSRRRATSGAPRPPFRGLPPASGHRTGAADSLSSVPQVVRRQHPRPPGEHRPIGHRPCISLSPPRLLRLLPRRRHMFSGMKP